MEAVGFGSDCETRNLKIPTLAAKDGAEWGSPKILFRTILFRTTRSSGASRTLFFGNVLPVGDVGSGLGQDVVQVVADADKGESVVQEFADTRGAEQEQAEDDVVLAGVLDRATATDFVNDLAQRVKGRVQITTDALKTYVNVIEDAFGSKVDFAQVHKVYRSPMENETRYSPAKCIGCSTKDVSGSPDPKHVSTSFVERQNWTVRTTMRRYTGLSNGFSRKLENHAAATAYIISPTTSSRFIVHFARPPLWPLA